MGLFDTALSAPAPSSGSSSTGSPPSLFGSVFSPALGGKAPNPPTPTPAPAQSSKGIFGSVFNTPAESAPKSSISVSTDPAGKPIFSGSGIDTSTPSTADPRIASPQTPESFNSPAAITNRTALKTAFGPAYSDEIDHATATAASGKIDPTDDDPATRLGTAVAQGKMSSVDAQTALAKNKGIPTPWANDPAIKAPESPFMDFLNGVAGHVHNMLTTVGSFLNGGQNPDFTDADARNLGTNKLNELIGKGSTGDTLTNPEDTSLSEEHVPDTWNDFLVDVGQSTWQAGKASWNDGTKENTNPMDMAQGAADGVRKSISEAIDQTKNFINNPDTGTFAQNTARATDLTGSYLNIPLSAMTGAFKGAEQFPVVGKFVKVFNTVLSAIGAGTSEIAQDAWQKLPFISQTTKNAYAPIVGTLAALAVQGKAIDAGHEVATDFIHTATELMQAVGDNVDIKTPLTKLVNTYKDLPNKQGGFVSVGGAEPEHEGGQIDLNGEDTTVPSPAEGTPENKENTTKATPTKGEGSGQTMKELSSHAENYVNENADDLKENYTSKYGNNFNVDNMKELIPGHAENRTMSEAFHAPAAKAVGGMVDEELAKPGEGKTNVFMAGSTAAGKTTAIESLQEGPDRLAGANMVVDGTLASDRALDQVRRSLNSGARTEVKYVENSPDRISDNLIKRAEEGGRTVPIETAYNSLLKSRQNLLRLAGKFGDDPNFNVEVIDNSKDVPEIVENGIDFLKSRSYSKDDIARFKQEAYDKVQTLYDEGKLTKDQYEGFTRRKIDTEGGVGPEKSFAGEESGEERERGSQNDIEKANAAYQKSIQKEELSNVRNNPELDQLKERRSILAQELENHPAKGLEKYANKKTGELPEVLGGSTKVGKSFATESRSGVFTNKGDTFASERGFKDSEEMRESYQDLKAKKAEYQELNKQIGDTTKDTRGKYKALQQKLDIDKVSDKAQKATDEARSEDQKKADTLAKNKAKIDAMQKGIDEANDQKEKYENAVRKATRDAATKKKEGFLQLTRNALAPLKGVDAETQGIYKGWQSDRAVAAEEGREFAHSPDMKAFKQVTGMQTIHDYEAGDNNPVLREHGDTIYTRATRAGIDLGYWQDHLTHLYKENPEQIREAVEQRMKDNGVDPETIDNFTKAGAKLDDPTAIRLRVNPVFSYQRSFPTYKEAMDYGLTPRYTNPVDIMQWEIQNTGEAIANRKFVDTLLSTHKLLRTEDAPKGWQPVNIPYLGKGDYMASPKLEQLLRNTFPPDHGQLPLTQRWFETAAATTAKAARGMQNFVLYGLGVGNVNFGGIAQAVKDATTLVGAFPADVARSVLSGDIDFNSTKSQLSLLGRYISSNFNKPTADLFEKMQPTFKEMAEQGINTNNRIGGLDSASWRDIGNSFLKGDIKNALFGDGKQGGLFSKSMESTKDAYLPLQQAFAFNEAKTRGMSMGMDENQAKEFAGNVVQNYSSVLKEMGTSQLQKNIADTVFMARSTRAGALGFFFNAAKAMSVDFNDPSGYKLRQFAGGVAVTYALMNYVNYKNTGHTMLQNGPSDKFNMIMNIPPSIGKYLPGYKPGDTYKVPLLPSLSFGIRALVGTGAALATGDFTTARTEVTVLASEPLQMLENVFTNQNYYGEPIYKDTDTGPEKSAKIAQYLGLTFTPSFVTAAVDVIENKTPLYQGLYRAAFLPGSFSTLSKDTQNSVFNAISNQTALNSASYQKAEQLYQQWNKLPSTQARANLQTLQKTDPATASRVKGIIAQAKAGFNLTDRMMMDLDVTNGARAQFVYQTMMSMPVADRKAAYDSLRQKKIVTPSVDAQIRKLIAQGSQSQ